ncbi:MAG: glycosyltransferase [Chitinivibrionales bacterium]|nr:glycosyltransferase [Chitinivibrionales bacterium]
MNSGTTTWPSGVFILIPAYQSARTLKTFLPRLMEAVPARCIFAVDDGSLDGTYNVCTDHGVEAFSHQSNRGKGAALATGFTHLMQKGARWIITMDADGQHAIADLSKFLEAIEAVPRAGIIIGARKMKPGSMPITRIFSNTLTSRLLSVATQSRIDDSQCGYRAYCAEFLSQIAIECRRFEMETEVILKARHLGWPVRFVKIQTLYFKEKSHISHVLDTLRWIKATSGIWFTLRVWLDMRKSRT